MSFETLGAKAAKPSGKLLPNPRGKLRDQFHEVARFRHLSGRTEATYWDWVVRYLKFHRDREKAWVHPRDLSSKGVTPFLTYLATARKVSASTQNQALNALLFLYREVLSVPFVAGDFIRARRPPRMPVVLTREEVRQLFATLNGTHALMARLLYGTGLRLLEMLRLRVKDVDFGRGQIVVHEGKGSTGRVTMLPESLREPLRLHLQQVEEIHRQDLAEGFGWVELPGSLAQKYPRAEREWVWQWVFPSSTRSRQPGGGRVGRHHTAETGLQRAIKEAMTKSGIAKAASCHTLRHAFATHLLESGTDIRTLQKLLGHRNVKTTEVYTHVMQKPGLGVRSPLDE